MNIPITPISVWSKTGVETANYFEVRHITYMPGGGAIADTHLLKEETILVEDPITQESVETKRVTEVGSGCTVNVAQTICDTWTDDTDFLEAIAVSIGLEPVSE